MEIQSEESSHNLPADHDLVKDNQMFEALIQPRESQPTKNKVKNFKNRVFQLLMLYADKCQNVNTLLGSLKQEMFVSEPQKIRQLVNVILNKQNITFQMLQQLSQHYKVMLLYKAKKGTNVLAQDFVRIIKKIASHQNNNSQEILNDMLKCFVYKRKCKIHADFFFYFLRKMPTLKKSMISQCDTILKDVNLRPAQKKQVQKLKQKLLKKISTNGRVKKQQNQQDSKQIKATGKPVKLTSSMQVQQKKNVESKKSSKKDARKKSKSKDKNTSNVNLGSNASKASIEPSKQINSKPVSKKDSKTPSKAEISSHSSKNQHNTENKPQKKQQHNKQQKQQHRKQDSNKNSKRQQKSEHDKNSKQQPRYVHQNSRPKSLNKNSNNKQSGRPQHKNNKH